MVFCGFLRQDFILTSVNLKRTTTEKKMLTGQ